MSGENITLFKWGSKGLQKSIKARTATNLTSDMGKILNPGNLYLQNTVHAYTTLGKVIFTEEHILLVCEHKIPKKISRHT